MVASNLEAAPGSPQRQHGGGPLVVSCGQYVQRAQTSVSVSDNVLAGNNYDRVDAAADGLHEKLLQNPQLDDFTE